VIILDTDHVVLVQQTESAFGEVLRDKLRSSADRDIRVTVVSIEEQMRGWLASLRRQQDAHRQVQFYDRLLGVVRFFARWRMARFDDDAADTLAQLKTQRVRIGTQDLKIASICLTRDATLLSSNLRDFQQVPGLRVEDWVYG
jgi:tRNA(fMet)-specific endonuclease VapC